MDLTEFEPLEWLVPALVVLGAAAVLVIAVALAVRYARRGPAARRRAAETVERLGVALVQLDDATAELDLEVALSGALYGATAPSSLRRVRMTAQHTRDDGFTLYRELSDPEVVPIVAERAGREMLRRIDRVSGAIADARQEHRGWVDAHVGAADQVAAAERRLAELRARMGDPAALLRELEQRADPEEWAGAARAADAALSAVAEAEERIAAARAKTGDQPGSPMDDLAGAERALRRADAEARTLEEAHRLVIQAGLAVADEIATAHAAIRSAAAIRAALAPDAAADIDEAIAWSEAEVARAEPTAARRPVSANEAIARVRERLDVALDETYTTQQRLRGARTALPGTLAAARSAIARAEAALPGGAPALDVRVQLDAARQELADARQMQDPVAALDAARRAVRHAEAAADLAGDHRVERAPGDDRD